MTTDSTTAGYSRKWTVLGIASLSTLLGTSDFSMVTIAFPTFTDVFKTDTATVVWVGLAYQLSSLAFVLPMGRLSDLLGRKRLFIVGLGIYSVGLLLAASAPGVVPLILFRAFQGVGAAMTTAISVALVTVAFPSGERGKALGVLQSAAGVGLMVGPAMGGVILDVLDWRALFYLRAPLGFASILIAAIYLPRDGEGAPGRRFDAAGAAALIVGLSAFAIAVNQGPARGWGSLETIALAMVSFAALSLFVFIERRVAHAVIDFALFRVRAFAVANGLMFLYSTMTMAAPFLMPFYLMGGRDLSATAAGLLLLTNPAILMFASPWTGRLSDRVGPGIITGVGLAIYTTAMFLFSTLATDSPLVMIVAFLALSGVGGALFSSPNQSSIMNAAPNDRVGGVSALIPTLRNMGLIIGVTVGGAIFASVAGIVGRSGTLLDGDLAQREAIVEGTRAAFLAFGGLGVFSVLLAAMRGRPR
jgi:EmrB/QacA subfamily drug resistance transporter